MHEPDTLPGMSPTAAAVRASAVAVAVALYCRISIDKSGRREGVGAQEQWGREYAAERWPGATIRVFADNSLSAARDDRRPQYEALRTAVRAGEITHVWTVEQSRLERRKVAWFELAAELIAAGIDDVHTRRDGLVRLDDIGSDVRAIVNARYVAELKQKTRDKAEMLAREGRPPGAVVFGYRHGLDDQGRKALHIVEEQADAVRWAAGAVLSGWSLTAIADELTDRGFTGAQGKRLRVSSVRSILSSPTIAGRRVHRGVEIGPGNWAAILDADTWQSVRSRLSGTRVIRRRDGRDYPVSAAVFTGNSGRTGRRYALTGGLTRCAVCGAPLAGCRVNRASGSVPYLRCQPSRGGRACVGIAMGPVEGYVRDALFEQLDSPGFRRALADDEHTDRREELTRALSAVDAQRAELADLWGGGGMSTAEWTTARGGLDRRESTLRGELLTLPPAPSGLEGIDGAREAWPAMTLDERREFLRLFIARVVVDRANPSARGDVECRVRIEWRHTR
jgi:DNA invertase Pin-like site-specific DNA recombinase